MLRNSLDELDLAPESESQPLDAADEALLTAEQTLATLERTKQMAAETARALHEQGEKLETVDEKLDNIAEDQHGAWRSLRVIKSWFGNLANKFGREAEVVEQNKEKVVIKRTKPVQPSSTPGAMFSQSRDDDHQKSAHEKYRQTDAVLEQMLDGVGELRVMTNDITDEAQRQNRRLDSINAKTADRTDEMKALNREIVRVRNQ